MLERKNVLTNCLEIKLNYYTNLNLKTNYENNESFFNGNGSNTDAI